MCGEYPRMSENSGGTPSFEIAGQMKTCVDHGCHIQVPVKKICMLNRNMFENLSGMLEVNTKQNREHSTARPPGQFEEENLKNVQKRRKRQISACLPTCAKLLDQELASSSSPFAENSSPTSEPPPREGGSFFEKGQQSFAK